MNSPAQAITSDERLLTFEVRGTVYALPIATILEVAETNRLSCVPGLPAEQGGIMNWSGEALPIIASHLLLDLETVDEAVDEAGPDDGDETAKRGCDIVREQILVVSDRADGSARLGVPIDRVIGLVDGGAAASRSQTLVQERRPIDGRVVSVLDPRQLVARAHGPRSVG